MKNERKIFFMRIAVIVLACILTLVSVLYISLKREIHVKSEDVQRREETLNLLQQNDIQELISHVRQVMAGEIVYEVDLETGYRPPLMWYSINPDIIRRTYPTMYTIESDLTVLEINLDDHNGTGEIVITYFIRYLDSSDQLLRSVSVRPESPDRWILERQDGEWIIVEVLEYKDWLLQNQ